MRKDNFEKETAGLSLGLQYLPRMTCMQKPVD